MAIIFKLRQDAAIEFDMRYDGSNSGLESTTGDGVLGLSMKGIEDLFEAFLILGDSGDRIISHRIMATRGRDVKLITIDPITNTPVAVDKTQFVTDVFAAQKFYVSSNALTMDESPDLIKMYHECAKLPYPIVFLEIFGHGVLVKKTATGFTTNLVLPTGAGGMVSSVVTITEDDIVVAMTPPLEYMVGLTNIIELYMDSDQMIREFVGMLISQIIFVLRALLFINTKNVTQHTVKPTRKELGENVPRVMVPKYQFKVIDIVRGQAQEMTLNEFKEQRVQAAANAPGKTTMVRGHFKRRKTGIYWWNNYIRNGNNKTTAGEVVKDYHLIAK